MATTYDPDNALAPCPPAGWNSYNSFGGVYPMPDDVDPDLPGGVGLDQRVIVQTAEAMVSSGLLQAGYVYLNLDDRWQDPRRPRDAAGILRADPRRFPDGMAALGRRLHELGLRFGLYTIANQLACGGEEGSGPDGFPLTGSLGREVVDAWTFAEWGVDFLKIDWCGVDEAGNRGRAEEVFATWNQAIQATGRPIVLSASTWGHEREVAWAPRLAHLWRTGEDLPPRWEAVWEAAHRQASPPWRDVCGPQTGWNDPDMLEVGRPGLSLDESWTHLVLAALTASPLLTSHDIRRQDPAIAALLLDRDILALNRSDAPVATFQAEPDGWEVWRRTGSDGSTHQAVVNLADRPRPLPDRLVLPGREIGPPERLVLGQAPPHGVRLTVVEAAPRLD
ncbi:MAG: glycoside hydrolase family 27 protein [Propionibacteriaceae bacterium]|jgi:alpha-galactosidase|nr:glycoside hydrolase family 27 protein [Propionibacteriaceae bacterium]